MSATSVTLDLSASPRSSNTSSVPPPQKASLSPTINVSRSSSINSCNKSPGEFSSTRGGSSNITSSPYISVAAATVHSSIPGKTGEPDIYGDSHSLYHQQYDRSDGNNASNSLPAAVILERSPIVVPPPSTGSHDVDPFVVTVRNSPSKLGKSNSASFIGKSPPAGSIALGIGSGGSNPKTGPRLALYRSNSSLDLLDRENYYHHRSSLGVSKLNQQYQHQHIVHPQQLQIPNQQQGHSQHPHLKTYNHQHNRNSAKPEQHQYTGCFTRRKDFGSHGSIDMLSNHAGCPATVVALKNERSGSLGSNNSNFLSLVASSMSRDRRGSFDVHDESVSSNSNSLSGPNAVTTTGKKDANVKETASPRLRYKFHKLWEHKEKGVSSSQSSNITSTVVDSSGNKGSASISTSKTEASIFRKLRGGSATSRNNANTKSLPESVKFDSLNASLPASVDLSHQSETDGKVICRNSGYIEERYRRRVFAHYDCQSVSANISYAARLRGLLSKRRNTTTGASAASLGHRPISTPPSASLNNNVGPPVLPNSDNNPSLEVVPADETDTGDGKSNALVLNCPYFRNEVGGEEERIVCLARLKKSNKSLNRLRRNYHHFTSSGSNIGTGAGVVGDVHSSLSLGRSGCGNRVFVQTPYDETYHRSQQARSVSLLDWSTGTTHWLQGCCPYSNRSSLQSYLEAVDLGAAYYRKYFYRQEHENWFGNDEILGPLAISVKKDRVNPAASPTDNKDFTANGGGICSLYMYRLIVRSTELNTLRGSILEESVPGIKPNSSKGGIHAKEVIEFLLPEIQLSCLKLGLQNSNTEDQLLKLDQQILTHRHKVGIMYCKAGQATEEEMYNNEEAGPAFNEFLDLIGQRVRLKGFDKYTGGLDNKDDSTGQYSVHSQYQDCEVIFHVSTLLPFTANNRQQLMRKRHIGNDIVTIVFQEPGALPFTPKNIRSQFQHVFIVVRALNPCSDSTCYSVSVSRSKEVPLFGPAIPEGGKFPRSKEFVDFLLAKVINAENATYRSEKFTTMATRTRQEYLKDLVSSCSTNTSIDPRPKFSIPFGNKKKELTKPKFNADAGIRGALSWAVYLDDNSMDSRLDAYLAISLDSVVIIDATSREPVFAIPSSSVLGWNTSMCNSLRIYYHQGECVTVHSKEPANTGENDELLEIVNRLEAVTKGCETQEFILRRNDIGQLGFHVQQDGVVTEVELCGFAAKAGLKQGSRLVEICKVAVATLTQDQMIDFLKTSNTVVVMVVLPLPDGTPRRGCDAKHCIYTMDVEGEYENLNLNGRTEDEPPSLIHPQFKTANNINSNNVSQQVQQQQPVSVSGGHGHHRKRYEPRSFSPPRSSNSSGYGTGSSSKSFSSASDPHFPPHHEGETLTSSSSGMSSADDRWYDLTENIEANGSGNAVSNNANHSPPPIPARNVNNISVHSSPGAPTKGRVVAMSNSNTNGTINGMANANINNNNNGNYMNGKNGNIYISAPVVAGNINPIPKMSTPGGTNREKSFTAKREFFQRNNPHHGSFHSKLTPSRSHDALHLKNNYGLHQPQLKAFPSSATVGSGMGDNYGAVTVASPPNGKIMLQRDHSSLGLGIGGGGGSAYLSSRIGGNTAYASPLLENTLKGKVTYLTDFPLTHSHSSEHLVGNGLINKDVNAMKNERLAALKSAYLDKHRERERERSERVEAERSSRLSAPPDSITGEISCSEDDASHAIGNKPRSASLNSRYSNNSSPKTPSTEVKLRHTNGGTPRVNRNSTLQEDLLKLINPDYVSTKELEESSNSTNNNSSSPSFLGHRPNSSGLLSGSNELASALKIRPVSCGNESNTLNSTPSGRAGLLSTAYGSNALRRPICSVEKPEVVEPVDNISTTKDDVSISSDMDWPSLVDTATKALQCCDIEADQNCSTSSSNSSSSSPSSKIVGNQSTKTLPQHPQSVPLPSSSIVTNSSGTSCSSLSNSNSSSPHSLPWIDDLKAEDNEMPIENVFNLEARVTQLEAELRKEQHSKQVLAAKVANLQQENRRLQQESSSTQHQFNKFKEWLLHTVDHSPTSTSPNDT